MLCVPDDENEAATTTLLCDYFGMQRFEWPDDTPPGVEFHLGYGDDGSVGAPLAVGEDLGRAQAVTRLVLASTSAQRRAILEQLRIPFVVEAPAYDEHDSPDADPVELVRAHAQGKARSVRRDGAVTLGVDTTVHLDGRVYGKPVGDLGAAEMLHALSGRTHHVVSGLCLVGADFEMTETVLTDVTFRRLSDDDVATYVASGEWEGRAGAYAIQGLGGRLVERIEGDYLNVVGLPGAAVVGLLERHAPELLQISM